MQTQTVTLADCNACPPLVCDRSDLKWLPVLMYHRVVDKVNGADPYRTQISTVDFDAQLTYLKERGYHSIALDEVPNAISGRSPHCRPVAISFDDGYLDNYTHALPILQKHGFMATTMLVSDCLGGSNIWDAGKLEKAPLLSARHICEMQRCGMIFGAHTASHASLPELSISRVRHELTTSKDKLEQLLGHEVATLAYPYGRSTPQVRRTAAELGYSIAFDVERWGTRSMNFGRIDAATCQGDTLLWRMKVSGHYLRLRENKLFRQAYRLPKQLCQLSLRNLVAAWQMPTSAIADTNA